MAKDFLTDKIKQMQLSIAMAESFLDIVNLLDIGDEEIADLTGVELGKIRKIYDREYIPAWNEYMALIFLFVTNEKSRNFVIEKGLYPKELREAMSINRKIHEEDLLF